MKPAIFGILMMLSLATGAGAQSTAFTYQGKLTDGGLAASGNYDLQFALFDQSTNGTQQGATIQRLGTAVTNGIFSVTLDFGAQFPGASRFLEISVQHNGGGFVTLTPRQQIISSPYSIQTVNASQLGGIAATQYVQTNDSRLSDARAPTAGSSNYIQNNPVGSQSANFNINGNATVVGGTISGNGSGLTNVTGANVTVGSSDPASPSVGRIYLNSSSSALKVFDGSAWQTMATSTSGGSTAANFLSAHSNNQQSVVIANAFQNIFFETVTIQNGWNGGPTSFTAPAGYYLVQYDAEAFESSGPGTLEFRAALNGLEIPGSETFVQPKIAQAFIPVSKAFIVHLNPGDVLNFQFTGTDTTCALAATSQFPSASMTIVKLQ